MEEALISVPDSLTSLVRMLSAPDLLCPPVPEGWNVSCDSNGPALVARQEGTATLGGVFDAFFEGYWTRFTAVRQIALRCEVQGSVRIQVLRRSAKNGIETCVTHASIDNTVAVQMHLPIALACGEESYLIVRLIAAAGAVIAGLEWVAETLPIQTVALGVAITTYNRDEFLVRNLNTLGPQLRADDKIIVVNHGLPGLSNRLSDVLSRYPAIRLLEQQNTGGAGGFTRGMVEHVRADLATHIVLMDDDIDLVPDLLERMRAALGYLAEPACIGGAMFDYRQRTRLFTAGDRLKPSSFAISHCAPKEGGNLSVPEGVDFLARFHSPDFNGWWCFAFPIKAIAKVGLPMPCFIRGDDVEFGYRLKEHGWPTVGWPGIAVWHMPFDEKSAPWQMFYDRRNSLFANAIHKRVGRWDAFSFFTGGFIHHLLRYDYSRVRAMTLGIAAFNEGPAAMASWTHVNHQRMIAAVEATKASISPAAIPCTRVPERLSGVTRARTMASRLLQDLLIPFRSRTVFRLPDGIAWRPDYRNRPARVVEQLFESGPAAEYSYSWTRSWRAIAWHVLAVTMMLVKFRRRMPSYKYSDYTRL